MSLQITYSWLRRLLLLVLVPIALILLIHVPGGIVWEYGEQPSPFLPPEILNTSWEWEPYKAELLAFREQLSTRKFEYYPAGSTAKKDFAPIFQHAWKSTVRLVLKTFPIGVALGLMVGLLYALRSRWPRTVSFAVSTFGTALPDFLLIALGHWLAIRVWSTYQIRLWYILSEPGIPRGDLLPTIALAIIPMGLIARLTASVMDDVMQSDYIRTARGKGVREVRVIFGHALKNAIPRIAAGFPTALGLYLSSLLVVEQLTNWPGMVKWAIPLFQKRHFGYLVGEWVGPTPQIVSLVTVVLVACYLLLEGLVSTVAILANRRQEVEE